MKQQIALALEMSLYYANPPEVAETKTTEEISPYNGPDHEIDSDRGPGEFEDDESQEAVKLSQR